MPNRSVLVSFIAVVINLLLLLPVHALTSVQLVKDINSSPLGASFSSVHSLVEMNGVLHFFATHQAHGSGLWRSDGTATGTRLVKKVYANEYGENLLVNANGTIFFPGADIANGYELWMSDGTEAGTQLVKDIDPETGSGGPGGLTDVNGTLFFTASDPTHGRELWKSDGTAGGTVLVKDITPGTGNSTLSNFISANGTLYFLRYTDASYGELWKSDGTEAGTVLVKSFGYNSDLSMFTNVNGTLFFVASDPTYGYELWKSNGTTAGTVLVKDLCPGTGSSNPTDLTNVNGTLFFIAYSPTTGRELWKSDGTAGGTLLVKDFNSSAYDSFYYFGYAANSLTNVNGTLFFMGPGNGLWKSDGTASGTVSVQGDLSLDLANQRTIAYVNGQLYLSGYEPVTGRELWKSDGTTAGTQLLKDIVPGGNASQPRNFTNVNGTTYFVANDEAGTGRLWKTDGTAAGTVMVSDANPGTGDSAFQNFTDASGNLYFKTGANGETLWKSDGTPAGTEILIPSSAGIITQYFTPVSSSLFFSAYDPGNGAELWKSDGTPGGTGLVKDLCSAMNYYPTPAQIMSTNPTNLVNVNGTLFFTGMSCTGDIGPEYPNSRVESGLFMTDGTAASTVLVKQMENFWNPGACPTNVNGTLFFIGNDPTNGYELWKSDGTAAGTGLVKDITPGTGGFNSGYSFGASCEYAFTNVNGILFFTGYDPSNGNGLWRSDGTETGTILLKTGYAGSLTNVNGTLFFTIDDPTYGQELWKSDGTPAGTVLVKDVLPGADSSGPQSLTAMNGMLFFIAWKAINVWQFWKSDGTEAGTVPLKEFNDVPALVPYNGRLFFVATDTASGAELWQSDGTSAGTVRTVDLYPGSGSSSPQNLTVSGDSLYFTAYTQEYGRELMRLTVSPVLSLASQNFGTVTIGNSVTKTLTLKNVESSVLHISAIQFLSSDGAQFSFNKGNGTGGTCGATPSLGQNQSCTMTVTFAPTMEGFFSGTLQVASDDPQNPLVEATLTGSTPIGDKTPPETTITAAPANWSSAGAVMFSFVSSEEGSTFQCNRSGSGWSDCTSPDFSGIGYGSCASCRIDSTQTFSVRAIDVAGNVDPTPASYTWTSLHDVTVPFANVMDGGEVQLPEVELTGEILLNRAVVFILKGGYDGTYTTRNGQTSIKGGVTISAGTLIVDGIIIK